MEEEIGCWFIVLGGIFCIFLALAWTYHITQTQRMVTEEVNRILND